ERSPGPRQATGPMMPKEPGGAAMIDGARRLQAFVRVVLPLPRPALLLAAYPFAPSWRYRYGTRTEPARLVPAAGLGRSADRQSDPDVRRDAPRPGPRRRLRALRAGTAD